MIQHFLGNGIFDIFTFIPGGRRPIAVNQPSGGGSNYPFTKPSDINQIIADAYFYSSGNTCTYALPISVKWLYGFGTELSYSPEYITHDYEILLEDANGDTVFDSRLADYRSEDWGDGTRYRIHEWSMEDPERIFRIVQHLVKSEEDPVANYPKYYEPAFAELDSRAITFVRTGVRSFRDELTSRLTNAIQLGCGYNLDIEIETDTISTRPTTTLTFNAVPGEGTGRYDSGCEETNAIKSINGVYADTSGNINLDGGNCYRIEAPISWLSEAQGTASSLNHIINIFNDCQACCSCDNFINTYEAIRKLRDTYADLISRGQSARDIYISSLERWNAQKSCRLGKSIVAGIVPRCPDVATVAAGFCNNTDACINNLVLIISFEYLDGTGEDDDPAGGPLTATTLWSECSASESESSSEPYIMCGSSYRAGSRESSSSAIGFSANVPLPHPVGGSYPYYYVMWDKVTVSALATAFFDLQFTCSEATDRVELVIDAYSLPDDLTLDPDDPSPVPGYVFGMGPMTAGAKAMRVSQPIKLTTGLLQSDCC